MCNWRGQVRRDSGKLLLVVIAVVILAFMAIVMWQSNRVKSPPPAPVKNSQPIR